MKLPSGLLLVLLLILLLILLKSNSQLFLLFSFFHSNKQSSRHFRHWNTSAFWWTKLIAGSASPPTGCPQSPKSKNGVSNHIKSNWLCCCCCCCCCCYLSLILEIHFSQPHRSSSSFTWSSILYLFLHQQYKLFDKQSQNGRGRRSEYRRRYLHCTCCLRALLYLRAGKPALAPKGHDDVGDAEFWIELNSSDRLSADKTLFINLGHQSIQHQKRASGTNCCSCRESRLLYVDMTKFAVLWLWRWHSHTSFLSTLSVRQWNSCCWPDMGPGRASDCYQNILPCCSCGNNLCSPTSPSLALNIFRWFKDWLVIWANNNNNNNSVAVSLEVSQQQFEFSLDKLSQPW